MDKIIDLGEYRMVREIQEHGYDQMLKEMYENEGENLLTDELLEQGAEALVNIQRYITVLQERNNELIGLVTAIRKDRDQYRDRLFGYLRGQKAIQQI